MGFEAGTITKNNTVENKSESDSKNSSSDCSD